MRPRVFPAEDELDTQPKIFQKVCFNEAAGIPRGRLGHPATTLSRSDRLQ